MADAGRPVRRGFEQAHHIVAQYARAAEPARKALSKVGIDINAAENGVSLRTVLHSSLHTSRYYEIINQQILDTAEVG